MNRLYVVALTALVMITGTIACRSTALAPKPSAAQPNGVTQSQLSEQSAPISSPTATTDSNYLSAGTYLVGTDIPPGLYRGQVGQGFADSCYWARLQNLAGGVDSILANDNADGQFYIQVIAGDKALETSCDLVFLPSLPPVADSFPETILPGTYLVGIEIQPGVYKGQGGTDIFDSCYWKRMSDLAGDSDGIIANDNASGQFYVEVSPSDIALETDCQLSKVSE